MANYDSFGYALATRVLQSEVYAKLDERERAECDELIRRGLGRESSEQPRFANVSCSQCGQDFGPGNHGYSHCKDHRERPKEKVGPLQLPVRAVELGGGWCTVSGANRVIGYALNKEQAEWIAAACNAFAASATPASEWFPVEWRRSDDPFRGEDTSIRRMTSPFYLGIKWAVRRHSNVLGKDGRFAYEPIPSSRDDAFYAAYRFDSFEDAVEAIRTADNTSERKGEGA
jgi:hypothetical protein